MAGMQSPWQGAAYLANTLVNSLQQNAAASQEEAGTKAMMEAFGKIDPATGATSEQLAEIGRYDPEFAIKLWQDRAERLNAAAKQEHWEPIPTPEGETGQWYRNSVTGEPKKVGGAAADAGAKLSDIGTLRDDYTKAATAYDASAPIWEGIKSAATRSLDPSADAKGKVASDYALIQGLAKILDPTSVVREGEVKAATDLGGLLDTLNGYLNKIKSEGSLTDDVRRSLITEAYSRIQGYYNQVKTKRDWLSGVATRHGINPDDIVAPLAELTPFVEAKPDEAAAASGETKTPPADSGWPAGITEEDIQATLKAHPTVTREALKESLSKSRK
jgi:hypothetical protein